MFLWVALVTGLGLSMDAVAASISSSTAARRVAWPQALKAALLFGLFQALMPALGYAGGVALGGWLESLDHWVAFILLGVSLPVTVAVIGLVTFSLCLPAVWLGKRLGERMAKRAELAGGLVLVGIGCKILVEQLAA
jgi:manganese efflux pump family protein